MGTSTDPEEELLDSAVDNRHASEFSAARVKGKNFTQMTKINIPGSKLRDMSCLSRTGEPETARLPQENDKTPGDRSENMTPISTVDSKRLQQMFRTATQEIEPIDTVSVRDMNQINLTGTPIIPLAN